MKTRKISLYKDEIYHDIDALTFKRGDVIFDSATDRMRAAVESDAGDKLDGSILLRLTTKRDADLRKILAFCLVCEEQEAFSNRPDGDDAFRYVLNLDDTVTDDSVRMAATLMHEYIVRGGFLDWYRLCGNAGMCPVTNEDELIGLTEDIASDLRGASYVKRPAQPFGPRRKL